MSAKHRTEMTKAIMKQTESYQDEHWMKLLGPRIWKQLHDAIDYIVQDREQNYSIVSLLLKKIATLEPSEFLNLIKIVLYEGGRAVEVLTNLLDGVEAQAEGVPEENVEGIDLGIDNSDEIEAIINANREDLESGIEDSQPLSKSISDMEIDELNTALGDAIEKEDYELAVRIRDGINRRS